MDTVPSLVPGRIRIMVCADVACRSGMPVFQDKNKQNEL